ncbi:MAG: cyclic nucleotide-binding domain-containing protein [bacterium]|nr:cyclic nucleotide-binding domain-containing protein [bacterium]
MKEDAVQIPLSQRIKLLESVPSFAQLEESFIYDLAERIYTVKLPGGAALFSQGDDAEAMYIVIEGRLQAVVECKQGRRSVVKEIACGEPVGVIALIAGGKHTFGALALVDTTVAELSRDDAEELGDKYPDIRRRILNIFIHRLRKTRLADSLSDYFGEMSKETFEYIESLVDWVHLKRGNPLFYKGDTADGLYVIIDGLLQVVDEDLPEEHRLIAEIHRGNIVGEMSIITGEKRNASIYAARDSDLVRLSVDAFMKLIEKYPSVMMAISRILITRLKNTMAGTTLRKVALNIAVIPSGPGVPILDFSQRLRNAFESEGTSFLLTAETVDRLMNRKGFARIESKDPRDLSLRSRLAEIEAAHSFVIYRADNAVSPWTKRCLARADMVVIAAESTGSPLPGIIEKEILDQYKDLSISKTLVLLHPESQGIPKETAQWLDARDIRQHYHIRTGRQKDYNRLARILAKRSIGVALGGGAAKGLAHIGVLRALAEAGIPVDLLGGSSMGAIVGALYAMGNDFNTIQEICHKLFIEINPFKEYTLPIISLMRGRKLERMGLLAYGDCNVEDLWINYFCCSSNLTNSKINIHRRGLLRNAVRTSSSLPGVVTPVLENGSVFVDGGVINNLPGDIMRTQCGHLLTVEVNANIDLSFQVEKVPSPWKFLWDTIIPFRKPQKIPNILDILLSSVQTGSFVAANTVKQYADLSLTPPLEEIGLLDFKKLKEAAEIGYNYTCDLLEKMDGAPLLKALKKE